MGVCKYVRTHNYLAKEAGTMTTTITLQKVRFMCVLEGAELTGEHWQYMPKFGSYGLLTLSFKPWAIV